MSSRSLLLPLAVLIALVAAGPVVGTLGAAQSTADRSPAEPARPPGAASADALATATPTGTATPAEPLGPSRVRWDVRLRPDGNATWNVVVTLPIRDENDRAAFDDIAARFVGGEYSLGIDQFRDAAAAAGEAANRSMTVRDVVRTTDSNETEGRLVLGFTWTNFGRVEGDRLVVGDAFDTPSGGWLPDRFDPGWSLVIGPPEGYDIVEAPRVVDRTAQWEGPLEFSGDQPRVVFAGNTPTPTPTVTPQSPTPTPTPTATTPTPTATATTTASPARPTELTTSGPTGSGGLPSTLAIVVLVLAVASAAVLAVYVTRGDDGGPLGAVFGDGSDGGSGAASAADGADGAASSTASSAGDGSDAATGPVDGADGSRDESGAASGAAGAVAAASDPADDESDEAVDVGLLSDEERVERLLDQNGGRMKQASIVKETGWSNAKVSQLLSAMEDDGRVDKLRIGRENLISFPDEDVTNLDSE